MAFCLIKEITKINSEARVVETCRQRKKIRWFTRLRQIRANLQRLSCSRIGQTVRSSSPLSIALNRTKRTIIRRNHSSLIRTMGPRNMIFTTDSFVMSSRDSKSCQIRKLIKIDLRLILDWQWSIKAADTQVRGTGTNYNSSCIIREKNPKMI